MKIINLKELEKNDILLFIVQKALFCVYLFTILLCLFIVISTKL